jgi:integrase
MTISLRIQERTRSAIVELVFSVNCDRIKLPRVSWHSFRHTHATLLAEVGESIKTAPSLLGHSDLGTTLNTLNGNTASCRTRCDGCYRQNTPPH